MCLNNIYLYVETKIGCAFAIYGRFVARHAWKVVMASVVFNCLLCVGILNLKLETIAENIYLPEDTEAQTDRARVQNTFPDLSGHSYSSLSGTTSGLWARVIVRARSGNLLNRQTLQDMRELNFLIQNISVTDINGQITKADICARSDGACALNGDIFGSPDFMAAVDVKQVTYPTFTYSAGTQNLASDVGGEVKTSGGYLTTMEVVSLNYIIRTDGQQYRDKASKWVNVFTDDLSAYKSSRIDVAYAHYNSLSEELESDIKSDTRYFSVTIILMIVYACLSSLSARVMDQVGQRLLLGVAGVLAAGLAIVSGFGLVAVAGVKFVSFVGAVPFLIIGIGINNMFLLMSGLSGAAGLPTVQEKMAETMRGAGVSITITSLINIITFMAASWSPFLVVRNVCLYTGSMVFMGYVNNMTMFAGSMAINERRTTDNRHFITCQRLWTKEDLNDAGAPRLKVLFCGGRPPTNREESEGFLDKYPRWLILKLVLHLPCKVVICLLFVGYLLAAIYGCIHLESDLKFTQIINQESYLHKYNSWNEEFFKRRTPVAFISDRFYNYSDLKTQNKIDELLWEVKGDPYFDETFEVNWLKAFKTSSFFDGSNEINFIAGLKQFLSQNAMFKNDVVFDASNASIVTSRIHVISNDLSDSQEEGKMMLRSREIAKKTAWQCYAYSPYFVLYEQYIAVVGQTFQSIGIALVIVFVVTCIFIPHLLIVVFVTLVVAIVTTGVLGFLYFFDVTLNCITMIHLIMSIGFSVNFTLHVCNGFMTSAGSTRDMQVRQAIEKTSASIFHAAFSSLLGLLMLVFAKSYGFKLFAIVVSFMLIFGTSNALLFIPVVLSWLGPGRGWTTEDSSGESHEEPACNRSGLFRTRDDDDQNNEGTAGGRLGWLNKGFSSSSSNKSIQMIGIKQL